VNTVLITVDALRADHLHQYGYDRDTMPVLDRLADDGVRFDPAFSNGTNTGISIPSFLSSQYFGADGVENGPNVASVLREAGVTTAGFHSNTFFATRVADVRGFDHYEDFDVAAAAEDRADSATERAYNRLIGAVKPVVSRLGVQAYAETVQEAIFPASLVHKPTVYVDDRRLTDEVIDWVRAHADEEFFLWVHYMEPHRPYGINVEDPAFGESAGDDEIHELMSKAGVHPDTITDRERERIVDLYDSDIRYTSRQVSRLLDALSDCGVWEETAVVFTADHGEEFDDHGHYFHRNRPYDELIRVPLVVRRPERDGGRVVEAQRELLDLAPTLCGWHGGDIPDVFRGAPLFSEGDREVIATGGFVEEGNVVAGRWDGWKYISAEGGTTELFDLTEDPGEKRDVAAENGGVVGTFERAIPDAVFEGGPVSVEAAQEGAVRQRLEDLGYLE
jgi:arylsulfatase A-like enzyme